jgi:uncharacterized membrane protein YebE (DUF533 family)
MTAGEWITGIAALCGVAYAAYWRGRRVEAERQEEQMVASALREFLADEEAPNER